MTGPAASEGVVQGAPAKETKPPGALVPSRKGCMAHQLALGVKKWEEILQQVLSIPFEESKWIWKGCLGLGVVTRCYWEEQDRSADPERCCSCSVS